MDQTEWNRHETLIVVVLAPVANLQLMNLEEYRWVDRRKPPDIAGGEHIDPAQFHSLWT